MASNKTTASQTRKQTRITVTRSLKNKQGITASEDSDDTIEVNTFATTPAIVKVGYPLKLSKNFQSVGIDVGIELPCYAEEVEEGFEKATRLVLERVKKELDNLKTTLVRLEGMARG